MRVPFYDIKAQHTELAEPIENAVLDVLRSGGYSLGKYHNQFEADVAAAHRVKHAIAVNSGTDALRILMDAAGIGPGDEVITTAFTFVASTETIVQTGATPVFVDIDPVSLMIDPSKIEAAITPNTRAILPVHLFGQVADMKAIREIAEKHSLIVIEDAAQAVLATQEGIYPGNFGIGAALSFYVTKNLGAIGDGGMILTNDDEIAANCKSIRIHGMGRERYYYDHLGYTSRLNEVSAASMQIKLLQLPKWNQRRAELANIYQTEIKPASGLQLPKLLPGNHTTWHQYAILAPKRDDLQAHLKANEVDSMIYYPVPLHFHKPYEEFGGGKRSLPVTESVCQQVLCLPIHQHLADDQVRFVAQKINEFYG